VDVSENESAVDVSETESAVDVSENESAEHVSENYKQVCAEFREAGALSANGLVVVDKEAGWTSHDVVARCRRIFEQRRVGHAGTLDPDATGVLLVGLGRVTRLLRFLTPLRKTYVTDIVLGVATSTLDASGDVVETYDMSGVSLDDVRRAATELTGEIDQVPPMVSAVKVGGRRLHDLARQGVEVERAARPVTIYRFDTEPDPHRAGVYRATIECSSGTYVRVLAQDLGVALGGGAHIANLRRTHIGSFGGPEMRTLDRMDEGSLLTPAEAMRDLETVTVGDEVAASIRTGLPLDRVPLGATGEGPWALVDGQGALLAVYEATGTDRIRPAVVVAGD
jgi:tRNA pseudouridine55 synthase